MIEIYKTLNDIDNTYSNIFVRISHNVNLRSKPDLLILSVNSVLQGKHSLRYFGSLMWILINIRNSESLSIFKAKIKVWKSGNCTCRLCKEYLNGVGFI